MNSISPTPGRSAIGNAGAAFLLIILIIVTEYFCRHFLIFWIPTIGTLRVNDMLSLVCAYTALAGGLGLLIKVDWGAELIGIGQALRACVTSTRYTVWIVAAVLSLLILPVPDRVISANLHLPLLTTSSRSSAVWLPALAPVLKAVSVIFVNGLFVPVAEEFLWRGFIQVRLMRVVSPALAIGITAVFFSLKHVIVDASFGRLLTVTALGIIFGILAHRRSWRASAALHILINTLATIAALAFGLL